MGRRELLARFELNQRAVTLCETIDDRVEFLRVAKHRCASGATIFDFGVEVTGCQEAGILLARICLADLATVSVVPATKEIPWPKVAVTTDQPIAACMASQYAGWEVKGENYFAMGSGPMRAAYGREPLFDEIGHRENPEACVGVLESSALPPETACRDVAQKCGIKPQRLTLLVAPTSSQAGTLQVVARSVEAVLHKLHTLGFDLRCIEKASGSAPLPSVAENDLAAIGRTNDAILYGGEVTLAVRGDDRLFDKIGPQTPSSASPDYGKPFVEILARYQNDFYQVDPLLFSAAAITFKYLDTGRTTRYGEINSDNLKQSFLNS